MEALLIAYAPMIMRLGFEFAADLVEASHKNDATGADLRGLHAKWGAKMWQAYVDEANADTTLPGPPAAPLSLTPAPGTTTTIKTEPTLP